MQAPKPTTYRGIRFRSKLEAQFAVYLDHHRMISAWVYEPFTLKHNVTEWEYTPDFAYIYGGIEYILEVKPATPTQDYLSTIGALLPQCLPRFSHLQIAIGSFYHNTPTLYELWIQGRLPDYNYDYVMSDHELMFDSVSDSIASLYRFDLAGIDRPPPACVEYQKKLQNWIKRKK